jgi:hypothetical protein
MSTPSIAIDKQQSFTNILEENGKLSATYNHTRSFSNALSTLNEGERSARGIYRHMYLSANKSQMIKLNPSWRRYDHKIFDEI